MMTLQSAPNAVAQPLRARIRLALDVSRVPESGFVAGQIAIHQEFESRQQTKVTIANTFQRTLDQLKAIAESNHWSQRKLATKIGIPETTLRRLKKGDAEPAEYLPKLQSAAARLQAN